MKLRNSWWWFSSSALVLLVVTSAVGMLLQARMVSAQTAAEEALEPLRSTERQIVQQSTNLGLPGPGQSPAIAQPSVAVVAGQRPSSSAAVPAMPWQRQAPAVSVGTYADPGLATYRPAFPGQPTSISKEDAQQATESLKALQADPSDSEARDKLTELLDKQFAADMEHRKQTIGQLQEQIDALKEQMAKREQARERIIDLRIELMINEADGLGFPSSWSRWPGMPSARYTVPAMVPAGVPYETSYVPGPSWEGPARAPADALSPAAPPVAPPAGARSPASRR